MGKEYIRDISVIGQVPSFGNIIYYDDFEHNLSWTSGGTGTEIVKRDPDVYFSSSASCYMKPRTAAAAEDDLVIINQYAHIHNNKRFTFECFFKIDVPDDTKYMQFNLTYNDGSNDYAAYIRYDSANTKWQYYNSASQWADISGADVALGSDYWNHLSISLDMVNFDYGEFIVNDIYADLSAQSIPAGENASFPYFQMTIRNQAAGANRPQTWIDSVLVHI